MSNFALLNNVDHQDVRIITERSAAYGDNVMYTMTFPSEFRDIQAHYPILFQKDESGEYFPIALFGFEQQENLFLDETGWRARYVPAMIRRQPFLIGYQKPKDQADAEANRMLSIDMDHPRISTETGEPLFQPLGGRTEYLEHMANLLEAIYQGVEHSKAFVAALAEHKLIESVGFDIALDDGTRNQLLGFFAIDEEKLVQLPGDVLESFSRQGFLMPLFMIVASMSNVRTLIEEKNRRMGR